MSAEKAHAVLDVGSNTVRLLVARVHNGSVFPIADRSAFVRLGQGIDASGRLAEDRMAAAIEAIRTFAAEAGQLGAQSVIAIATSAVRDARNGAEFVQRVRRETGIEVEIISGDREADLTFRGATLDIDLSRGAIVCDLGGGSAELIYATSAGISWRQSVKLGSSRLSERFIHHDPPEQVEIGSLRQFVEETLASLPAVAPDSAAPIAVFTGGTASHVARMCGSDEVLTALDPNALDRTLATLADSPAGAIADRYGFELARAEVLPAGAAALAAIAGFYRSREIVITRRGIREGVLLSSAVDGTAG